MNWFDYYHELEECLDYLDAFKKKACLNKSDIFAPFLCAQFVDNVDIWEIFEYIEEVQNNIYFHYATFPTLDERIHAVYYTWLDGPEHMVYVKAGEAV